MKKRIKLISDIKTLEDLNHLKLQKKYEKDLKKLELKSSLIQLQLELAPEKLKETIMNESQSYGERIAAKYLPSFLLRFFKK